MVMLRGVDGEHLARGFEKTLGNRVAKLDSSVKSDTTLSDVRDFVHRFEVMGVVPGGTTFDLFRDETGTLTLVRDGTVLASYADAALGWCAVDAFLGVRGHLHDTADLVRRAQEVYDARPIVELGRGGGKRPEPQRAS